VCLIFYTNLSESFHILRRIHGNIIINVLRSSFEVIVILVRFSWILNNLNRYSKSWAVPIRRMVEQTDRHDEAVTFQNCANAPKKSPDGWIGHCCKNKWQLPVQLCNINFNQPEVYQVMCHVDVKWDQTRCLQF
jgi:hypothetical protein